MKSWLKGAIYGGIIGLILYALITLVIATPICTHNLIDGFPANSVCILPMALWIFFKILFPVVLVISTLIGAFISGRKKKKLKRK